MRALLFSAPLDPQSGTCAIFYHTRCTLEQAMMIDCLPPPHAAALAAGFKEHFVQSFMQGNTFFFPRMCMDNPSKRPPGNAA